MNFRVAVMVAAAMTAACGGSVTNAADAATGGGDGEDASMCPPSSTIPDADIYLCEAAPAGSAGCSGAEFGDKNVIYPEGCTMISRMRAGFCDGTCCGPLQCTCQRTPGFDDGGPEFVCPG
jgi:hypothetical protein